MKVVIPKGATSRILTVFVQDSSSTTGAGLGSLTNASSIVGGFVREGSTGVALAVDEDVTTEGTYQAPSAQGKVRIGTPANMRTGTYELHFHNNLWATGAETVTITLGGATNMAPLNIEVQLSDPVRGLGSPTALPNAAAEAAGGLVTNGTSSGQLSLASGRVTLADGVTHGGSTAMLRLGASSTTPAFYVTNSHASTPAAKFESSGASASGLNCHNSSSGQGLLVTSTSGTAANFESTNAVGLGIAGSTTACAMAGGTTGLAITGALTVSGTTSLAAVATSGTVTLNALTVSNATTLTGAVSLGSTLTVTGAITATNASNNLRLGTFTVDTNAIAWNASWDTEVQSEVQDAIEANHLDHLIAVADPGGVVANSSFLAKLVSKSATPAFSSYDNTTDALEALRDRGDAAWITATGFSTHSAADVWAVGTRVLTAGTNITGSTFTAIPWNSSWDAEVQSEVIDALQETIPDSIPADGTRPSVQSALYMMCQGLFEGAISGTTWTIKKVDGSTTLFTVTLDSSSTPTTKTRAS